MENAPSDRNTTIPTDARAAFAAALPRLTAVAAFHARRVRCPHARADAVGETVALCWTWFVQLIDRGRDPASFLCALARFAALAVRSGRRATGYEKAAEVLSPWAQARRGFAVAPLPVGDDPTASAMAEAVAENTVSPVPDQVQFRCDFPAWRRTLPAAKRALVDLLAAGHRTAEAAAACGVSAARVSQLRQEFRIGYRAFCHGSPRH